jgi:hypothetical protein
MSWIAGVSPAPARVSNPLYPGGRFGLQCRSDFHTEIPRELLVPEAPQQTDSPTIDLKDPIWAAILAWLVPGLGHWYQGRRAKAVLFFVCIMGLFGYGVYLGGGTYVDTKNNVTHSLGYGRAVYYSMQKGDLRLYYLSQVGVGLPALPALVQAIRMNKGQKVFFGGFMSPPRPVEVPPGDLNEDQPTAHDLNFWLNRHFELATIFTAVAGLLNILVIYDAFAGPAVMQPAAKKEVKEEEEEPE